MKPTKLILGCLMLILLFGCRHDDRVKVINLRLDMKENPTGIDSEKPRFSWQLTSPLQDVIQTAYMIEVAESPEQLEKGKELIWNSGQVASKKSILIPYNGQPLEAEKTYYWRVKAFTNQGETAWSSPAHWSMTLDSASWKARWIGESGANNPGEHLGSPENRATRLAARYLRKPFTADKPVKKAVLYISGQGANETYLNGKRVSDDVLSPTVSLYPERVYYNVYDVTDLIQPEQNTMGVVLGNGRYFSMRNPTMKTFGLPLLLAQLQLEYADGTTETIVSDTDWKVTSKGPIVANNEFDGEIYDAALEMPGWSENGFDDSSWAFAELMEVPEGKLLAQPNPNICVMEEIQPIAVYPRPDGKYLVDMGQNMVGWLAVSLQGKAGKPVTMRFSELINPDSTLYVANLRSAKATDVYTPAADGLFVWEPSFVYHGFRFVEIDGLDVPPTSTDLTGRVVYDKMATTGNFQSSDSMLNKIHQNAYWGIRGNYRGMPTDCPQRDERLGWLGDRATGAYGEAFLFDNALLYSKWLQDIEDSMTPEGSISAVSPNYWMVYSEDVTWPSAFIYAADMLRRQYGDDSSIRKHYPAMKRWMNYIQDNYIEDYIVVKDKYGDWCMPPESQELIHSKDPARKTDGAILSTTVYYDLLNKMAEYAAITGNEADIAGYEELAGKMKSAYNTKYFNPETAQYGNNTVTANMLSLRLGLVPEGFEQQVFDNIVAKTNEDFDGHVSTGVVGIQHLMRGLTENGRKDMALQIATNETYPSWGYMINNGATTIWELWNGNTADPAMNSANHVMLLGDLLIWYYEDLAGIRCAPGAVAYEQLEMAPIFPDGLDEAAAVYESVYGPVSSAWNKTDNHLVWDVELPANTSARVRIPAQYGVQIDEQPGIRSILETPEELIVEIGSGKYHFESAD